MNMRNLFVALLGVGLLAAPVHADHYAIDPHHTELAFSVRHMAISDVRGSFKSFSGHFDYDPAHPADFNASATIDVASIDTRVPDRDADLRSPNFFEAEKYPHITFSVTRAEGRGGEVVLVGELTMKGIAKEIQVPITIAGPIIDPWGNQRVGFSGSTTINRQDWNIAFNGKLATGDLVVGDQVTLTINVEGIKQKEE